MLESISFIICPYKAILRALMKLFYIANTHIPTGKTHGIQIMEMCQAFAAYGVQVSLVVRDAEHKHIKDDPFDYYDVSKTFSIQKLWCLNITSFGRIGFWIESITFALSTFFFALSKRAAKKDVFYTRDEIVALTLLLMGKRVTWEAHMGHTNMLIRGIIAMKGRVVVITEALKALYESFGLPSCNILVAPDGADVDRFDISLSKEEARTKLGLPQDKKIILYKGSLGKWKGADILALSAQFIKTPETVIALIGGVPEDVERFRREYKDKGNVLILGKVHRRETPVYQKAADVLVIPNSAKEDISKLYTSPMKLFGYMAGGRPVVASDLPSLREILTESNARFFEPDNPESLARTIDAVLSNYDEALRKAEKALEEVREYSWSKRAVKILDFIRI
jgi:glycosyltransferase involved in cell wall biosynthesis